MAGASHHTDQRERIGEYEYAAVWGKPHNMTVSLHEDAEDQSSDLTIEPVSTVKIDGVLVMPIRHENIHHFSLAGRMDVHQETSDGGGVTLHIEWRDD